MNLKADELYLIRTGLKHAQRKTRDQIDPDFVPEPGRFDSNISKYHRIAELINKITDELEKERELEKANAKIEAYEEEDENDWREDFWEVRVFATAETEFTITVKADDEADACEEASAVINKMLPHELIQHDQYGSPVVYQSEDWNVLNVEESHGFENTEEDLKLAKECAWNVETN